MKQELQTFFSIILNQYNKDADVGIRTLVTRMAKRPESQSLLFSIADIINRFKECTK